MREIDLEIQRWIKEQWAVDPKQKKIYLIDDKEVLSNKLIIYSGAYSNSSDSLDTLEESSLLEAFRELVKKN